MTTIDSAERNRFLNIARSYSSQRESPADSGPDSSQKTTEEKLKQSPTTEDRLRNTPSKLDQLINPYGRIVEQDSEPAIVQGQLTTLGYNAGENDGIAGPRTAAAVRAFQEANGLTVDGIIGPQTRRALEAATNKASQPPGPPALVDGSDRKFYIQASEQTGDPAILKRYDQDLRTYNDFKTAQTYIDPSERIVHARSGDPESLGQFDRDLASYNRVKGNIEVAYQNKVDQLINEQGLEPAVAENLVTQQFEALGIPRHALPDSASTSQFDKEVFSSDRRHYAMSSDPATLEQFDSDLKAYYQYKEIIGQAFDTGVESVMAETGYSRTYSEHLVTQQFLNADTPSHLLPDNARTIQFDNPIDGSDRRHYMMASELANDGAGDPTIIEQFDETYVAYNDHKDALATSRENRVQTLMHERGYDRRLAEDMASLEFNMQHPSHLLPEAAKNWNFDTPPDGSDRRLNPEAFDRALAAQHELQSAIDETYNEVLKAGVTQLVAEQDINREVAEYLVGMELGSQLQARGIPANMLPESMTFNPGKVLTENHGLFDNALDSTNGLDAKGGDWSFGRIVDSGYDIKNGFLGLDNDGKVGLADLDAIIDNPSEFPSDVVAASMVLRKAADNDEQLRSYFDQPNFWERLKDSPWLDPNTDSFVVNASRAIPTYGLSLFTADEFRNRVIDEGPGVLQQAANSVYQLSPLGQEEMRKTDPGRAHDNARAFVGGAGDFFVDTGKFLGGALALSNPALAGDLYKRTGINIYAETANMATAAVEASVFDPDQMARDIIGWDQFVDDPFRWAGNQAPDIVLEILGTKGASKAARAARVADGVADTASAGRRILAPAQELIDDFGAKFLRSDVVDGRMINHLKLGDNHYQTITELADGSYDALVRTTPPPPRAEDAILLDSDPQVVNPRYTGEPGLDSGLPNRWENCIACAQAMDAHLAGYPASALPGLARKPGVLEDWIGTSFRGVDSPQAIVDELTQAGDGARGIVLGDRGSDRVGHAFNVTNDGGVIRFIDGQNSGLPAKLDGEGYVEFHFLRTDNASALKAADGTGPASPLSGTHFAGDDAARASNANPPERISLKDQSNPHASAGPDNRLEMTVLEDKLEMAMDSLRRAVVQLDEGWNIDAWKSFEEAHKDIYGKKNNADLLDRLQDVAQNHDLNSNGRLESKFKKITDEHGLNTNDGIVGTFQNLAYERRAIDVMRQHGYDIRFLDDGDLTDLRARGAISPHLDLSKNPESLVTAPVYDAVNGVIHEGRVLDVHTPMTVASAWDTALSKVHQGQADGVIINLARVDKHGQPVVSLADLFDGRSIEDYKDFVTDRRATNLRELWIVDESGGLHAVPLNLFKPDEIHRFRVERGIIG